MRLWSLHPHYLDVKGLLAVWREGLLARHVLAGKTVGYRNHPQLRRFREAASPLDAIDCYLAEILREAERRNYSFDREKIGRNFTPVTLPVAAGQLAYERDHLLRKLAVRDPEGRRFRRAGEGDRVHLKRKRPRGNHFEPVAFVDQRNRILPECGYAITYSPPARKKSWDEKKFSRKSLQMDKTNL